MRDEKVQSLCQQIFVKNLKYLEKNHNHIFKQIEQYEINLVQDNYLENYALEYINNSFNIKNTNDDSLLYDKNLDTDAIFRVTQITTNSQNIFKVFESITMFEDENKIYLEWLIPFFKYMHQLNSGEERRLSRLDKFVFFGCLLGKHIELFIKTYKPKSVFIVEQILEIFKLSLFVTDYSKLADTTQIEFYIGKDETHFTKSIDVFLGRYELSNYMIKYDFIDSNYSQMIDIFSSRLKARRFTDFPFDKKLMSIDNQLNLMKRKYKFINFNKIDFANRFLFLIINSELSLVKNLNWLKANHDKVLIVISIKFLKLLNELQIKPHIIIATEEDSKNILNDFFMIPEDFYSQCILFSTTELSSNVLELFNHSYTYLYQSKFEFLSFGLIENNHLMEEIIVSIISKFGAERTYKIAEENDIKALSDYLDDMYLVKNKSLENNQLPIFNELLNSISKDKYRVKYVNLKIFIINKVLKKLYEYQECKHSDCKNMLLARIELMMEIIKLLNEELGVKVGLELFYSYYDYTEGYFNRHFKDIDECNTIFQLWLNPQILIFEKYQQQLEEFKLCENCS